MNQTNKYKKFEKQLLIFLLNLGNTVRILFLNFIKFFIDTGNQKVTIMLIPHNEKKVFNFRLNIFILFTILVISFSTIGIIFYLTIDNFNKSIQYKDASLKTQQNEKLSREYEEIINNILDNHRIFKGKLNLLLTKLNSPTIKTLQETQLYLQNQGGIFNPVDIRNLSELEQKKIETGLLLQDYQYSIQAFSEINKMVDNYNKLLKDLPYGCPVKGFYTITSTFGFRIHPIHKVLDMHSGIDMAYQAGTPIVATAPGIVEKVEYNYGGYGWYLKISHQRGFSTLYAHLRSQPIVSPGDKVVKGQIIGYMGSTGEATGTHLHYEIRLGNTLQDPWPFISNY